MKCARFLIVKIPLKFVRSGQRNGLHSVVAFFHKAKWTELAITYEMNGVLRENTISDSTRGIYFRMFVLSTKETDTHMVPESEGDFSLDALIVLVLSEEPFLSVRQIAMKVMISKSTVYRHLTPIMRWKLRHLKWVRHCLTESEQMNRVQGATELLDFYSQSHTKSGNILSPLTSHGFIRRSIGSSSGFQRIMAREQGQEEGSITIKRC
jgi:DNA-binding transcriptional ArsR family regulator